MIGRRLIVPREQRAEPRGVFFTESTHDGLMIQVRRTHVRRLGALKGDPVQALPFGEQGVERLLRSGKPSNAAGQQMKLTIRRFKTGTITKTGGAFQTFQQRVEFSEVLVREMRQRLHGRQSLQSPEHGKDLAERRHLHRGDTHACVRADLHESLGLELAQRLAHRDDADLKTLRESINDERLPRFQGTTDNLRTQGLIDRHVLRGDGDHRLRHGHLVRGGLGLAGLLLLRRFLGFEIQSGTDTETDFDAMLLRCGI